MKKTKKLDKTETKVGLLELEMRGRAIEAFLVKDGEADTLGY